MADQASFIVALIDKVTGPARKMQGGIAGVSRGLKAMVAGSAKTRDELGKFEKGNGGLLKSLQTGLKGSGEKLGAAVESGVGKLKEGMAIGALVVAGIGAALGAVTVKMADFAQVSSTGFAAVAKHGASAEKLFAHSRQLAEGLGLDVMDTTHTMVKFLSLQFNPKQATDFVKLAADMRGLGASAESVQSILNAVGKIKSQGKVQGDEFQMLAEAGVSTGLVYEALGKKLGKTKDEIVKMQAAGKLTDDLALPAILEAVTKKTGKPLGQLGKEMAETTLSGMAGVLKAKAQNAFIDTARDATPAIMGAFKAINAELQTALSNKSFSEGLVVAFEHLGRFIQDAIPFVKTFMGSLVDGFSAAWPAIKQAVDLLFSGFGGGSQWMGTAKEFGALLGKIAAGAVGVAVVMAGMFAAGIQLATGLVNGLIGAWNGAIEGIGRFIFAVSDGVANIGARFTRLKDDVVAIAGALVDGLVNGVTDGIGRAVAAVQNLGAAMLSGLKGVLGIHSPSKEFMKLGDMSGVGFTEGLQSSLAANDTKLSDFLPGDVALGQGPMLPSFSGGGSASLAGAGGGRGGGNTFEFNFNITQAPGQSSEELAREIAARVRREVTSILEQAAIEAA